MVTESPYIDRGYIINYVWFRITALCGRYYTFHNMIVSQIPLRQVMLYSVHILTDKHSKLTSHCPMSSCFPDILPIEM